MSATDVVMIVALIFALGLGFFVMSFGMNTVMDKMINNSGINSSEAAVQALEDTQELTNRLDYVIFGVFIGLCLALIITGWYIGGNPIFMFIYFIVVVISVVIAMVLSNTWEQATQMTIFGLEITRYPITNNLVVNGPIYAIIEGFIGLCVMFAKPYLQR